MCFVFAYFINEIIKKTDEPVVLVFGMRNIQA
jgi:hypothetical protein